MDTKSEDDECLFLGYFYIDGFSTKEFDGGDITFLFGRDYDETGGHQNRSSQLSQKSHERPKKQNERV